MEFELGLPVCKNKVCFHYPMITCYLPDYFGIICKIFYIYTHTIKWSFKAIYNLGYLWERKLVACGHGKEGDFLFSLYPLLLKFFEPYARITNSSELIKFNKR